MRILKNIFVFLFILILALLVLVYVYCQMQKPVYTGTFEMPKLNAPVKTYFDNYGVPHIYGSTEEDVFRILGYLHAKERMFQMELRASSRLSLTSCCAVSRWWVSSSDPLVAVFFARRS